jgi:predicted metal-dependent phosphoesterase TrpH
VSKVDLHIHTNASDGKFTPAEIVHKAADAGLQYIAICDHDSIEGVVSAQVAANSYPGVTVIGGVEINTDTPEGELHILGYFYDQNNPELKQSLERLRNSRIERAQKIINKLRKMGIKIDFVRVEELAGEGSIGRPHIAQAMLEKGYINSFREAFMKYINRGGPAYVERDKITPTEAIQLIARAGGLPVLAHPLTLDHFESAIAELKPAGLIGMEVYYNNYSPQQVQRLQQVAQTFNLVATGGSDYHGLDSMNDPPLGTVEVPLEAAEQLIALNHR